MTDYLHNANDAGKRLASEEIVAFPTETVFGLGGDARKPAIIERIFQAKGRPNNNPLIVHVDAISSCSLACDQLPSVARNLLNHFAPGPITVVVPKNADICPEVTGGLETVGIRIPSSPIARSVLRAAEIPVAAPSANLSGRPSCTTWQSVREDLDGRIDAILCLEEDAIVGLESTVVDCLGPNPHILRPGKITLEQIQTLYPEASIAAVSIEGDSNPSQESQLGRVFEATPPSPGMLHPHYQPKAPVRLFETAKRLTEIQNESKLKRLAIIGLGIDDFEPSVLHRSFDSLTAYATGFYESLREADRCHAELIAVQLVPAEGIGIALRDRQRRAAGEF